MQEAADKFAAEITAVTFSDPKVPLFSNVTGKRVSTSTEIRENIPRHMVQPVLWTAEEASVATLLKMGGEWVLLETGPGKVLTNLWKDTGYGEQWQTLSCGKAEEIENVVGE
jgi:[acyl-carrier-protein] S-malonyltransferase